MKMNMCKETEVCWRWPTDSVKLPCFAQNTSPAADRFIMYQADASYRGLVNCHKAIKQPIILTWLVWGTAVEKMTKGGSACADKWKSLEV